MKDYYATLRVHPSVSEEEIKEAYHRLVHKYHPDMGGNAEQFKELQEAYSVLGDPYKRGKYDTSLVYENNIRQREEIVRKQPPPIQPQVIVQQKKGLSTLQIALIIIGIIIVLAIIAG